MRKLVREGEDPSLAEKPASWQTSLETFDEVDPCDVDEEEDEDEASQKVFGRSDFVGIERRVDVGEITTSQPGDAFKTLAKFGDALRAISENYTRRRRTRRRG